MWGRRLWGSGEREYGTRGRPPRRRGVHIALTAVVTAIAITSSPLDPCVAVEPAQAAVVPAAVQSAVDVTATTYATALGDKTSDIVTIAGGFVQHFRTGDVYWSRSTQANAVFGVWRSAYAQIGGAGSSIGLPTSTPPVTATDGWQTQRFSHGILARKAKATPAAVIGRIFARWTRLGGAASIGYPTSNTVVQKAGRSYQAFTKGTITLTGSKTTGKSGVWHIPTTYRSQLRPVYAPSGCVYASLLMALQDRGYAWTVSKSAKTLRKFMRGIPRASTEEAGFVGSPFRSGSLGVDDRPTVKYAKKWTKTAANLSKASARTIIREVKKGHPVIVFSKVHAVTIIGYKKGKFLVYDPLTGKKIRGVTVYTSGKWTTTNGWHKTSLISRWLTSNHGRAMVVR